MKSEKDSYLNVLVYADNVTIVQENVMAFCVRDTVRSKVVMDDRITEQLSSIDRLGSEASDVNDKDTDRNRNKFQANFWHNKQNIRK